MTSVVDYIPYYMDQGTSKEARDLAEIIDRLSVEFPRLDKQRAAMLEQRNKASGVLSVRSDATSGMVTITSGSHTVVNGMVIDIAWSGGERQGVIVGTVEGNNIPFSGGTGYDLPSQNAAVDVWHYARNAKTWKIHTGTPDVDGNGKVTVVPDANRAAYVAYEVASLVGVMRDALAQADARFRAY